MQYNFHGTNICLREQLVFHYDPDALPHKSTGLKGEREKKKYGKTKNDTKQYATKYKDTTK